MKKVTEICDICERAREIVETVNDKDYCHNCFGYLMRDVPQSIRDDYMPEMALEVVKYDAICSIPWDGSEDDVAERLTETLKKWGITAHGIDGDDTFTIGFKKK